MRRVLQLAYGLTTFLPVLGPFLIRWRYNTKGTGGTCSARYCYSVWLRHLIHAKKNGYDDQPETMAELGPGDSLGVGLAALISGTARYHALDVFEYVNIERNIRIFEELVELFRRREKILVDDESDFYDFPSHILDENRLRDSLAEKRLERIRHSILTAAGGRGGDLITYKVPWTADDVIEKHSVDMILSQAVIEHIDERNLSNAYRLMNLWLKPTGYISHQIDFRSHGYATTWDGHWTYNDFTWKLLRGRRPFFINRVPFSEHVVLLKEHGFEIRCIIKKKTESTIRPEKLPPRFYGMSEDDLSTSDVFIQASKKALPDGFQETVV